MLLVSGRVSVPKPLSQIQRSTLCLLQGLSPRPSLGGFGLKQHLEASPFLVLALNLAIRHLAWLHGSDRKHEPRASGWFDPQGRHYVHLSAAEWKRSFPTFGTQTHRSVVRCGRDAGLLRTTMNQRRLHIRVDFTKLILLYLASGRSTTAGWLTEPPPAEGSQLSADG